MDDDIELCAELEPDAFIGAPVLEGPEGPKGDSIKGDKGDPGPTGEGASDPGDLTLLFDNKLI